MVTIFDVYSSLIVFSVFGGHGAFSKNMDYLDVGYIIMDEEQLFCVQQKEALHKNVNSAPVLWMTATPIHRTMKLIEDNLMILVATTVIQSVVPVVW